MCLSSVFQDIFLPEVDLTIKISTSLFIAFKSSDTCVCDASAQAPFPPPHSLKSSTYLLKLITPPLSYSDPRVCTPPLHTPRYTISLSKVDHTIKIFIHLDYSLQTHTCGGLWYFKHPILALHSLQEKHTVPEVNLTMYYQDLHPTT